MSLCECMAGTSWPKQRTFCVGQTALVKRRDSERKTQCQQPCHLRTRQGQGYEGPGFPGPTPSLSTGRPLAHVSREKELDSAPVHRLQNRVQLDLQRPPGASGNRPRGKSSPCCQHKKDYALRKVVPAIQLDQRIPQRYRTETMEVSGGKQFGQKYSSCEKCDCGNLAKGNPAYELQ